MRRIVLASSAQVIWWRRITGPFPITETQPPAPKAWYAATKMFMESIGYSYSQMHGISVIVARIGWCPRPGQEDEIHSTDWAQDIYLSPKDAGRFFASCICAPEHVRHLVVNVTSIPKNSNAWISPSQGRFSATRHRKLIRPGWIAFYRPH